MNDVALPSETKMIPRRQQGTALTLVIIVLAAFVSVSIPLSPTLTITVVINTNPTAQTPLAVSGFSYDKVPISVSIGAQRDVPSLVGGPTLSGTTLLVANVTYSGITLSPNTSFPNLSDGTYQIKVTYFPRSENSGTPYLVGLSIQYAIYSVPHVFSVIVGIYP